MMRYGTTHWVLLAMVLGLTACDEADIGSAHVQVKRDGSGTICLVRLAEGRADQAGGSIAWNDTAPLVSMTTGSFTSLSDVRLGDLRFEMNLGSTAGTIVVELPRGPDVTWPELLTVTTPESRARVRGALESAPIDSKVVSKFGDALKIQFTLPGPPGGNSVIDAPKGVKTSTKERTVTLLVPVDVARSAGPAIAWHLTYAGGA